MECEPGEVGELWVSARSDTFFSGYLGMPRASERKIREGWYRTGDSASWTRDHPGARRVVRLHGRWDDLIRSGGETIQPDEVERWLSSAPGVGACAVVGVRDAHWGQRVVAAVVPAPPPTVEGAPSHGTAPGERESPASWVDQIDRHMRRSPLADFKRPRAYLVVDSLPWTAGGKLRRSRLREQAERAKDRPGAGDWRVPAASRGPGRDRSRS